MGVNIYLEDEHGKKLDSLIDYNHTVEKFLPSYNDSSFYCLRFVDLYGNTMFNILQMPQLEKECNIVLKEAKTDEVKNFLEQLLILIDKCKNQPYTSLKFYGD